jgi:arginase
MTKILNPSERVLRVIGARFGYGAGDPRCALGPEHLRALGVVERLTAAGRPAAWLETLSAPGGTSEAAVELVAAACGALAGAVRTVVERGEQFLVLGGDHSCAIGTWSGVRSALGARGPLGLIWIDAHLDSHIPETSPSGALHGMPAAVLLGHGHPELVALHGPPPKLLPRNLCLVGVRCCEPAEKMLLKRLGVRVYFADEVQARGLRAVLAEAREVVCAGTAGYGLSIDLDVLDPEEAPGVGTPVARGLHGSDLADALFAIGADPRLLGVELAELNPALDREDATALLALQLLSAIFSSEGGHSNRGGHGEHGETH